MLSIQTYITCIVHNLGTSGVARKIQALGSFQVGELYIANS